MISKVLSIAVVLILIMVIPGVVSGAQKEVYGAGRPNLLIGGIDQSPNTLDKGYANFADKYNAVYVPTYYSGNIALDAIEVDKATSASYIADDQNGLTRPELRDTYDTIFAYSGGTRSALTAMIYLDLKANTLVLISPICGTGETQNFYYEELKGILDIEKTVKNIVVLQATKKDRLPGNDFNGVPLLNYQARVSSADPRIKVFDVDDELTTDGIDAHKELFFSYAYNHLPEILSAAVAGASNMGTQPQEPVAPAVQGPGNSVVGKWSGTYYAPTEKLLPGTSGHGWALTVKINIYANGTWDLGNLTGKWIQTGDTVYLQPKDVAQQTLVMKIKSDNGIMKMEWINNTPYESWNLVLVRPWEPTSNAGTHTSSLVNVGTGTVLHKLAHTYAGPVKSVAFSSDGSKLATIGSDMATRIWDVATGTELHELKNVRMNRFSPDGSKLATDEANGFIIGIWDVNAWTKLHELNLTDYLDSMAFSPDGSKLATGDDSHAACIWDVATGTKLHELKHDEWVSSVAFSPDGSKLATGSEDSMEQNSVRIWDTATGNELHELKQFSEVNSVAFSPDGSKLAALGDAGACIWDVATGAKLHELLDIKVNSPYYIPEVTFSPDSSKLATICDDNTICIWNVATGRVLQELVQNGSVTSIAFSPDGSKLATSSLNYTAYIWDVATGTKLQELKHDGPVLSVSFSPDGSKLATGCENETALIWDVTARASTPSSEPMSSTKSTTKTNTTSGFDAILSIAALLSIFILWKGR